MSKVSRRQFLQGSGASIAAGVAVTTGSAINTSPANANAGNATLPYEAKLVGEAGKLKAGETLAFTYPDDASPCALVKVGEATAGGIGPEGDIVAYSTLCSHMGCPVIYDAASATFKCPCHYSIFDPSRSGQQVCGQATQSLPQIELEYNASDDSISAIGVRGLIYGRQSNIL